MHQMMIRAMIAVALLASGASAQAESAQLAVRWSLLHNVLPPEVPHTRSLARFTITNLGSTALPAKGWGLYFNAMANVLPGAASGGFVAERLTGQLVRLRPGDGFAGLAPGASLDIDYLHTGIVYNSDSAPHGPYLAFDDEPEKGSAITDYEIALMTRPEQLRKNAADVAPLVTPQMLYAHNANTADLPAADLPLILPTPTQLERLSGSLRLTTMPRIDAAPALRNEAAAARALLASHVAAAGAPTSVLRLRIGKQKGHDSPEAYQLAIDPKDGISVTGATPAALFRGLQSLRELLPAMPGGAVELPALRVADWPRFAYRGFQLDVARSFHPKETVFRLLDLMARYKLNKFHFHLTDDEGWRLEIAGFPELTAFGAQRGHTMSGSTHLPPSWGSGPQPGVAHGSGHYTRAEYIAILRYAAARHIEVIPEIEMPGHARAAVKAMESRWRLLSAQGKPDAAQYLLHDPEDSSVYTSPQQYHDHVLNPGMEGTYKFIERVVADVAAMHKAAGVALRTIHVGGDELPEGAWEKSPASLAMMKRHQLASSAGLWDYFYDRVDRILKRHGMFASGWEELGSRTVSHGGKPKMMPNPVFTKRGFKLYVWNNRGINQDLAYRLANAGYGTVLAPVSNLYFDMAHDRSPAEHGVNWGGYVDLDTVFDFKPFDFLDQGSGKERLTEQGKANILGLEATLFTETVYDQARLYYLSMPSLLALAERAWAADPAWAREPDAAAAERLRMRDWSVFANQLGKRVLPRIDGEREGILYRIAPPGLTLDQGRVLANHQLPGMTLRYTSDGSEPKAGSPVVDGPIGGKGTIRVAAFARNGRSGISSQIDNP